MSHLSASGLGDKTVPCAGWSESQEHTNGVRVFPAGKVILVSRESSP